MTGFFKKAGYLLLGPKVPLSEVTRINAGKGFRDSSSNRCNTTYLIEVYAKKNNKGSWTVVTEILMRTQGRQDHTTWETSEDLTGREAVAALRRAAKKQEPEYISSVHVTFTPNTEDSSDGKVLCLNTAEMRVKRESFGDEPEDLKGGQPHGKPFEPFI